MTGRSRPARGSCSRTGPVARQLRALAGQKVQPGSWAGAPRRSVGPSARRRLPQLRTAPPAARCRTLAAPVRSGEPQEPRPRRERSRRAPLPEGSSQ
eukprot:scaffold48879_cov54-Phaeocystis_antarctica.AAC.2